MENIFAVILGVIGGLIAAFGPFVLAFYAFQFIDDRTNKSAFAWVAAIAIVIGFAYLFSMWNGEDIPIERPCNHC